jgi:hypothetical protein
MRDYVVPGLCGLAFILGSAMVSSNDPDSKSARLRLELNAPATASSVGPVNAEQPQVDVLADFGMIRATYLLDEPMESALPVAQTPQATTVR